MRGWVGAIRPIVSYEPTPAAAAAFYSRLTICNYKRKTKKFKIKIKRFFSAENSRDVNFIKKKKSGYPLLDDANKYVYTGC